MLSALHAEPLHHAGSEPIKESLAFTSPGDVIDIAIRKILSIQLSTEPFFKTSNAKHSLLGPHDGKPGFGVYEVELFEF